MDCWSIPAFFGKIHISRAFPSIATHSLLKAFRKYEVPSELALIAVVENTGQKLLPRIFARELQDVDMYIGATEGSPMSGTLLRIIMIMIRGELIPK